MSVEKYINDIFEQYEQSPKLLQLKEEVISNLSENVRAKRKQGMIESQALTVALEELGDIEELLREYPKNNKIYNIVHWVAWGSIVVGILFALLSLLTVTNEGIVFSAYLAVGILHPFVDIQVAYLVWENKKYFKNIWKNIQAVATAIGMFFSIDIISNLLWYQYYNKTLNGVNYIISSEIVIVILMIVIIIFCANREKTVSKA